MANIHRQHGAVSLFAVIFSMLLLIILTIGFTKLMVREQQQATNNDLSQSAYDSALAGVEDAKRLIRSCHQSGGSACTQLSNAQTQCQAVGSFISGGASSTQETVIQSSNSGNRLDQAYTCVLIQMATPDYLYSAAEGKVELIPLRASDTVEKIAIEWYSRDDTGNQVVTVENTNTSELPARDAWGATAPPVLRAQLITPGSQFTVADLDSSEKSKTVFLRPAGAVSGGTPANVIDISGLSRATNGQEYSNAPVGVVCTSHYAYEEYYACRAELTIPALSVGDSNNAFLRLNTIYKGAQVRVTLLKADGTPVNFEGIQPAVDATGRASNLFRRVEARLRVGEDFPYPSYAVDVENSICKDFSVTEDAVIPGVCRP